MQVPEIYYQEIEKIGVSGFCATRFRPRSIDYVYSLRSPITYDIFYVGRTSSPKDRLWAHKSTYNFSGKPPIMRIIDSTPIRTTIDEWEAEYKEVFWIQKYNEMGWPLLNKTNTSADLSRFQYYSAYLRPRAAGIKVPIWYYEYVLPKEGMGVIYDRNRLSNDKRIAPVVRIAGYFQREEPEYVPYYRDTNPDYYDDDY
jgi:predicted GIY-YIG superfamily endonuclease